MIDWQLYAQRRWDIEACRKKIAELRASGKFQAVRLGAPRLFHGKCFYHILVCYDG